MSKPGYRTAQIDISQESGDFVAHVVLQEMRMSSPEGPSTVPTQPPLVPPSAAGPLDVFVYEVQGRLRRPLPGAQVTVQSGSRSLASGATGPNGTVRLVLPPGEYEIIVSHPGYATGRTNVRFEQGPASTAVMLSRSLATQPTTPAAPPPMPTSAALQVQVAARDSAGRFQMLPEAQVTVSRGREVIASQKTDANGYTAFRLPPGEYDLAIAKDGYESQRSAMTLPATGALQRIMLKPIGPPIVQIAPGLLPVDPKGVETPT